VPLPLLVLLVVLCAGPALALGGVHRITLLITAALALVALVATFALPRVRSTPLTIGAVELALLLGVLLTLLQLLPLPLAVRQLLSPHGTELRAALGQETGGLTPLTLDPAASLYALTRGFCVVAVFFCVRALAGFSRGRTVLPVALVTTAAVAALIGGAQRALSLKKVYGLYQPRWDIDGVLGTFVNNNHNAGFYVLGALLALGLSWKTAASDRRWLGLGVATGLAAMVALTASRGALVGLAAGGALLALAALRPASPNRRGEAREPQDEDTADGDRRHRLLVMAGVALMVAVLAVLAYPRVASRTKTDLANRTLSMKPAVWRDAVPMLHDHPVVGIGRGAWQAAYPRYKTAPFELSFTHPENQIVQVTAEWGLAGGVFLLLLIGGLALAIHRAPPRSAGLAAGAALVGIGTQALFDFGLETPGLALPAAVCLGMLVAGRPRSSPAGSAASQPVASAPRTLRAQTLIPILALVGVFGAVRLASPAGRQLSEDDQLLQRMAADPSVSSEQLRQLVQEALGRHPVDYQTYATMAFRLIREKDATAVTWLNRALWAAPRTPHLHVAAARLLLQRGRVSQAALEYRLALRQTHQAREHMLAELCRVLRHAEVVAMAIPDSAESYDEAAAMLVGVGLREQGVRLAEIAHLRFPGSKLPAIRLGTLAQTPEERLRWARAAGSDDEAGGLRLGAALVAMNLHQEAVEVLERQLERGPRAAVEVRLALADAAARNGSIEKARKALAELIESLDSRVQIRALRALADIEDRARNPARAQAARHRAGLLEGTR
jgi:O-antigen ligase/tetratricopeptide (TPR) repeat protein